MAHVIAAPQMMTAAARDMETIGATLDAAHLTAASPTLAVPPAGADEVSASIAHLFSDYGQEYQTLARQAAASHEQFVQNLTASAGAYASAEAANVAPLKSLTETAAPAAGVAAAGQDVLKYLSDQVTVLISNLQAINNSLYDGTYTALFWGAIIFLLFWPVIIPALLFLIWWQSVFFIP